jgi:hypothetical protein
MARINGMFSAQVVPNGMVQYTFTPTGDGCGNMRLILAPGIGFVEDDLVTTFDVRPAQAKAAALELEQKGVVDIAASVDDAALPKLVLQRGCPKHS